MLIFIIFLFVFIYTSYLDNIAIYVGYSLLKVLAFAHLIDIIFPYIKLIIIYCIIKIYYICKYKYDSSKYSIGLDVILNFLKLITIMLNICNYILPGLFIFTLRFDGVVLGSSIKEYTYKCDIFQTTKHCNKSYKNMMYSVCKLANSTINYIHPLISMVNYQQAIYELYNKIDSNNQRKPESISFIPKVRPGILITGAAGGVGTALAIDYSKKGYNLCLIDIMSMDSLKSKLKVNSISNQWLEQIIMTYQIDIGDSNQVISTIQHFTQILSLTLDIIIINAGIVHSSYVLNNKCSLSTYVDQAIQSYRVNSLQSIIFIKALIPLLTSHADIDISKKGPNFSFPYINSNPLSLVHLRRKVKFVFISSVTSFSGIAGLLTYGGTKAYLNTLVESLQTELNLYYHSLNKLTRDNKAYELIKYSQISTLLVQPSIINTTMFLNITWPRYYIPPIEVANLVNSINDSIIRDTHILRIPFYWSLFPIIKSLIPLSLYYYIDLYIIPTSKAMLSFD